MSNGFRFSEVYKSIRDRSEDPEMVSRIMQQIKSDRTVHQQREEQLKKYEQTGPSSYVNLGMGILILILGFLLNRILVDTGIFATLPYILMVIGGGVALKSFFR